MARIDVTLPISREAAEKAGAKFYFTGEACANGHVAERRTNNGNCAQCVRQNNTRRSAADNQRRVLAVARQLCSCCTDDDFAAFYADAKSAGLEVDHVEPIALGGPHCLGNLQALTPEAHAEKTKDDVRRIRVHRALEEIVARRSELDPLLPKDMRSTW